jgi:hypothetical protein
MQNYIKENVIGIVDKMTLDLIINKPDDVISFMKQWLKEKGSQVQKEYQRKRKNRPEGVETSESSDEEDYDDI